MKISLELGQSYPKKYITDDLVSYYGFKLVADDPIIEYVIISDSCNNYEFDLQGLTNKGIELRLCKITHKNGRSVSLYKLN